MISISMSVDSVARESVLYRKRYNYGVTIDTQFSNIIAAAIWELTFLFLDTEPLKWKRKFRRRNVCLYNVLFFDNNHNIVRFPFCSVKRRNRSSDIESVDQLNEFLCKKIIFFTLNAHFFLLRRILGKRHVHSLRKLKSACLLFSLVSRSFCNSMAKSLGKPCLWNLFRFIR